MAMEFNRIITLLRKERGITQKQAAADLGISQAQLSHYEKGIRECGLEFVVQVCGLLRRFLRLSARPQRGTQRPDHHGGGTARKAAPRRAVSGTAACCPPCTKNSSKIRWISCLTSWTTVRTNGWLHGGQQLSDAGGVQHVPPALSGCAQKCCKPVSAWAPRGGNMPPKPPWPPKRGSWPPCWPAKAKHPRQTRLFFAMTTESLAREYPRHATSLMNLVKNSEEAARHLLH